jgi:hypothetical protein
MRRSTTRPGLLGPAKVQVLADGRLKPGPSGLWPVEYGGIGDLQLAHGEVVAKPARPIL